MFTVTSPGSTLHFFSPTPSRLPTRLRQKLRAERLSERRSTTPAFHLIRTQFSTKVLIVPASSPAIPGMLTRRKRLPPDIVEGFADIFMRFPSRSFVSMASTFTLRMLIARQHKFRQFIAECHSARRASNTLAEVI